MNCPVFKNQLLHSQRDDPSMMHLCPTQVEDITLQQQHVFSETKTLERKTFAQRSKRDECLLHLGLGLPCTSESPNRRRAPGEGREGGGGRRGERPVVREILYE